MDEEIVEIKRLWLRFLEVIGNRLLDSVQINFLFFVFCSKFVHKRFFENDFVK